MGTQTVYGNWSRLPLTKKYRARISPRSRSSWCLNRLMNELLTLGKWKCLQKRKHREMLLPKQEWKAKSRTQQRGGLADTLKEERCRFVWARSQIGVYICLVYLLGLIFCSLALFKILISSAHSPFPIYLNSSLLSALLFVYFFEFHHVENLFGCLSEIKMSSRLSSFGYAMWHLWQPKEAGSWIRIQGSGLDFGRFPYLKWLVQV